MIVGIPSLLGRGTVPAQPFIDARQTLEQALSAAELNFQLKRPTINPQHVGQTYADTSSAGAAQERGWQMTHSEQCKVVAQQLLCALDTYEASFSAWAATPSLLDFSRVEAKLQTLRMLRVLLPQVSDEMADVFTAHADLGTMHIRDKTGAFGKQHSECELACARNRHSAAIDVVRCHCLWLVSESDTHAASSQSSVYASGRADQCSTGAIA